MDAHPPERPPLVAQLNPEVKRRLDEMYKQDRHKISKPLQIENWGPIKSMKLGAQWKDLGVWPKQKDPREKSHGGNRFRHHDYRIMPDNGTLRVEFDSKTHSSVAAAKVRDVVNSVEGPVPREKWSSLDAIFGSAANANFFKIDSVHIDKLGGRRTVVLTGTLKETGTREKNIYVCLGDDWQNSYEFGIGVGANKDFASAVSKFDKALETVVWKSE